MLVHASRVIDAKAVVKLREVSLLKRPGPVMTKVDPELARAAFPQRTRAPLTADAVEALSPKLRPKLAARIGVPVEMLWKPSGAVPVAMPPGSSPPGDLKGTGDAGGA